MRKLRYREVQGLPMAGRYPSQELNLALSDFKALGLSTILRPLVRLLTAGPRVSVAPKLAPR